MNPTVTAPEPALEGRRTACSMASHLTIVIGRNHGTVVLTLDGRLERADAALLARMLDDLIDAQGNLSVVVDLISLSFLDRAGADVLRTAMEASGRHHGRFCLRGASPEVAQVLVGGGLAVPG